MYIGKKLQEILLREKISTEALSKETNIELKDMEAFIDGEKNPTLEEFVSIVNVLHISPNEILGKGSSSICKDLLTYERKLQRLSREKQEELIDKIENFLNKNIN